MRHKTVVCPNRGKSVYSVLVLLIKQKDRLFIWILLWITTVLRSIQIQNKQTTLTSSNRLFWGQIVDCWVTQIEGQASLKLTKHDDDDDDVIALYCTASTTTQNPDWEMVGTKDSNFYMIMTWGTAVCWLTLSVTCLCELCNNWLSVNHLWKHDSVSSMLHCTKCAI